MRAQLFKQDGCPSCEKAEALLNEREISVEIHRLELMSEDRRASFKKTYRTVPQVFIDGARIGGYEALRDFLGT